MHITRPTSTYKSRSPPRSVACGDYRGKERTWICERRVTTMSTPSHRRHFWCPSSRYAFSGTEIREIPSVSSAEDSFGGMNWLCAVSRTKFRAWSKKSSLRLKVIRKDDSLVIENCGYVRVSLTYLTSCGRNKHWMNFIALQAQRAAAENSESR